jgi:hypothetical protein
MMGRIQYFKYRSVQYSYLVIHLPPHLPEDAGLDEVEHEGGGDVRRHSCTHKLRTHFIL